MRLAVLIVCHNRRAHTERCLSTLIAQVTDIHVSTYLLDDGSTDGTVEAVSQFPGLHLLHGDGTLFWNKAMHLAFAAAMADGYDGYLWLNDDVSLDRDALARLADSHARLRTGSDRNIIVVGSTRDPDSGKATYGGLSRVGGIRPLTFRRVEPGDKEIEVDTMNGNFVYVPAETTRIVGNLDPAFHHHWGDVDYGLRARAAGIKIWLMPGTIGSCRRIPASLSWRAPGIGIRARWARMNAHRGIPWSSWIRFARRHGGPFWPLYVCWAYRGLVWPERPVDTDK